MATPYMRGFLADDEGNFYTSSSNPTRNMITGQQVAAAFDRTRNRTFRDDLSSGNTTRIKSAVIGGAPKPTGSISGPGSASMRGTMRGVRLANEAQGRDTRSSGYGTQGDDMTTLSARPSMRSLGAMSGMQHAAADGWEHPDVRAAKLRILQGQADAITSGNIERARRQDPNQRAYDQRMQDESDVASVGRRMPIFRQTRDAERDENVEDVRAEAYERGTNPYIREEIDFNRDIVTRRESMDALARILGSIRPETAELFENNPDLINTIRDRALPGGPSAAAQPVRPPQAQDSPSSTASASPDRAAPPDYGPIASAADMPPVMRVEIEQWLRENRFAVNDRNLMAAYNRLSSQ